MEGSRRREKNGERLLYISIQEHAGDGVWYTSLILCTVYFAHTVHTCIQYIL